MRPRPEDPEGGNSTRFKEEKFDNSQAASHLSTKENALATRKFFPSRPKLTKNNILRFAFHKMIGFVFIVVFAFSFPCEGTIFLPPEGDTFVVAPGTDVKIAWTFNDTNLVALQWYNQENILIQLLAAGVKVPQPTGMKLGVDAAEPATLILNDVDLRHNGTYRFEILLLGGGKNQSFVTVFVAVTPTVSTNCSSLIEVDKGDDVRCLCKAEGANPPGNVNVTWYEDGVKIGDTKKEKNMLYRSNVDKKVRTYKCVAQSLTLTNATSIKVKVNFAPEVESFTSSPKKPVLGKSVNISCEASGLPLPSYTIIYNGTYNVSAVKTYTIDVVNSSHAGSYQCVAKNRLGKSSKKYYLIVISKETAPPTTATSKPTKASGMPSAESMSSTSTISVGPPDKTDDDDKPSPGLIAGIVIGVLLFLLILIFLLWWFKCRKEKSSGEHICNKYFRGNDVVPGNQGNVPVAENAYESLPDGEGKKPENLYDEARLGNDNGGAGSTSDNLPPVYATVDKDKKKNKKKDKKKNEPAPANTPPVYATVDKTRHNEPSVTYATLDTVAMQPTGSSKRDRRDQPTEYASIAEFGVKGDLV